MFKLPDLAYAYDALEPYIDSQTMELHHSKHHATYVEKLNKALDWAPRFSERDIFDLMRNLRKVPENLRSDVQNNGGGHANHSFFWEIMTPAKHEPKEELVEKINSSFESFDEFKLKFTEAAMKRFGSGWVWLIRNYNSLVIESTPNQNNPWMEGKVTILGLDVWEHAYYLKFQNRRVDYINAWWNVVNWNEVLNKLLI